MGEDRPPAWSAPWAVALASGLLAGLALPPLGMPPLLWPALAVLWSLTGGAALRQTIRSGLLWGLAAVLVSHRWLLGLHPLDWIGVPGPLSLPLCLLLLGLIALFGGVLVALWLLLARRLDARRPGTALVMASLWGLAEVALARGPLFWLGLGSAALPGDRPLAGLATVVGAGGLAALQLLLGWGLWRALAEAGGRRRWLPALGLLVLVLHAAGALALERAAAAPAAGPAETVLVLQPAISTRRKFEAAEQRRLLRQLVAVQRSADRLPAGAPAGEARPTSLLLPEGALALGQPLPEPAGVEVLSGGFRLQGEEQRSSLLRFAPGQVWPSGWVDKHRVVPLGEWVPLADLWRWSGLSAVGGIEPGPASRLLARPTGPIGVAICYEVADGAALAAATRDGARWLLATANLDPYPLLLQRQFAALAALRAIETGRWLVSSANTGPSLVLDPSGRRIAALPPGRSLSGPMTVQQRSGLTPYDRWGEGPLLGLLLIGLLMRSGKEAR